MIAPKLTDAELTELRWRAAQLAPTCERCDDLAVREEPESGRTWCDTHAPADVELAPVEDLHTLIVRVVDELVRQRGARGAT